MKKHFKRFIAFFTALMLCLCIAACAAREGKSAYEIALENGFVGSEQQWLESLVGMDGADGRDGADAEKVDIFDLYNAYKQIHSEATFEDFLAAYSIVDYTDTQYAAAIAMRSIVQIISTFQKTSGGQRPTTTTYYSAGSGVVYRISSQNAYIITNYHVVYDNLSTTKTAQSISVLGFGEQTEAAAELVGGSLNNDIAVLKVASADLDYYLVAATIANSNEIKLGARTIAVGNPLAEGVAVTSGVISVDSEEIQMSALDSNGTTVMRVIRTDTSINSGNSGGGLFNMRGELIGIVNAKTVDEGVEGVGYAIPCSVATAIADCILDNNGKKASLGIGITTSNLGIEYKNNTIQISETVFVDSITQSSLAQGILEIGDIINSVYSREDSVLNIARYFHLYDFIYSLRLGDTLTLNITRSGQNMTVSIVITGNCFVDL